MIRNPLPWPNGARCAVAVTFDMDADSLVHIHAKEKAPSRVSTTSMLRYGPTVAVPRILETYRKLGIQQTFFVPAWCAGQYPEAVEAMIADGHEVGLHSYIHENSYDLSRDEEQDRLRRSMEILERVSGRRPVGWRAPMYSFSQYSGELLAEEGFLYDASLMGDDVPYLISTPKGRLVELPAHWGMDDYPQYAHTPDLDYMMPVRSPSEAIRNYMDEFEAHHAHGGLWIAVWHPFLTGRLSRWHHLEKMLFDIQARGDVWFATLEQIAEHLLSAERAGTYVPRVDKVPFYHQPVDLEPAKTA
ncbi:peptidoglycan/xylan/chitin deacetylase (PgdA/CDA1 family) [Rhodoligotrophos appendicifer]|uniref:polysaccharide deacetylase family protein n=1 Tax=Rhodoligotrophos appendicifer TaxID=987056 RepID=UPI00117D4045|nr:polysaccharide deacetylase [Rhodoligotrophos appendicifer]